MKTAPYMATLAALAAANPGWNLTMRSCGFKQSTLQCLVRQGMYSFSVKRDFEEMTSEDEDGVVALDEAKVADFGKEVQDNIDKAEEQAQKDMEERAEAEDADEQKAAEEAANAQAAEGTASMIDATMEVAEANEANEAADTTVTDPLAPMAAVTEPETLTSNSVLTDTGSGNEDI